MLQFNVDSLHIDTNRIVLNCVGSFGVCAEKMKTIAASFPNSIEIMRLVCCAVCMCVFRDCAQYCRLHLTTLRSHDTLLNAMITIYTCGVWECASGHRYWLSHSVALCVRHKFHCISTMQPFGGRWLLASCAPIYILIISNHVQTNQPTLSIWFIGVGRFSSMAFGEVHATRHMHFLPVNELIKLQQLI